MPGGKRKVYRFRIENSFSYTKNFKLLKEQSFGFDKLKDLAVALFKSKASKDEASKKVVKRNKIIMKGAMNKLFLYIGGAVVVLGIIFILMMSMMGGVQSVKAPSGPLSQISFKIIGSGVASYGEQSGVFTPFVVLEGNSSGVDNVYVQMEAATSPLPHTIYVLRSRAEQASGFNRFLTSLKSNFEGVGITVNELYLEDLDSVPPDSGAVVVIPTGYLPVELTKPDSDPSYNLRELVDSGLNVIYIGNDFTEGLLSQDRGRLIPGKDYSVSQIKSNLKLSSGSPSSSSDLKFISPKYTWTYEGNRASTSVIYGCVSVIKIGTGHLIVFPNSLDGGWTTPEDAASDVYKVIAEREWLTNYGEYLGSTSLLPVELHNGSFNALVFPNTGALNLTKGYAKVYVVGYSGDSKLPSAVASKYLKVSRNVKGTLSGPSVMLPTSLVNQTYRLKAYLNGDPNLYKQPVAIMVSIYNASYDPVSSELFTKQMIIPVEYSLESNFRPNVFTGNYLVKLYDPAGRTLAQMVFRVPDLSLEPIVLDWKRKRFRFKLISPETETDLTKALDGSTVIVDGKFKTTISVETVSNNVYAYFEVNDPKFNPVGQHTFKFTAVEGLTWSGSGTIYKEVWEEPYFIITLLVSGLLGVIGYLFKAKDTIKYSLDVPEFEVRKRVKVPLSTATIVQLIERLDKEYGWKYVPLKLKEIKSGLAKIHWQGRPLMVTDFNLKVILDILISRGIVREYLGYYGLEQWVKESGKSFEYLAMYRAVRDILITHAVRFTQLGESKFSDLHISTRKGEFEVVFSVGDPVAKALRALKSDNKVIVLFPTSDDLLVFWDRLYLFGIRVALFIIGYLKGVIHVMDFEEFKEFISK